jgi:hypothetical protein
MQHNVLAFKSPPLVPLLPDRVSICLRSIYPLEYMYEVVSFLHVYRLDFCMHFLYPILATCRSQWLGDLTCRSATARLLGLWVRIPPLAWMSFCCDCRVLSGRGLCDELITRPEKSYRLCCVVACDLETSWKRRPWPTGGAVTPKKKSCYLSMSFPNWL